MEPLTHMMFGGVLARAGLNRQSALATAALVLAAEAPDIDVVARFGGRAFGFVNHRGLTHTFIGLPLVAALVVGVLWVYWRLWGRRRAGAAPPRWGRLYLLAILGCLSHILLDFTNNYGVRPFWPFYDRWFSWDIVFIVEPILWAILVGGLLLPMLFGLINREIRSSRRRMPAGRTGAVAALLLVALFWGISDYEHRHAVAAVESLTYGGEAPVRVGAGPYMSNPFRWFAIAETNSFYQLMEVDSRGPEVDPLGRAMRRVKSPDTPATLAAKNSYLGRAYVAWAHFPVVDAEQLSSPPGGYLVRLSDLRYAYPSLTRGRSMLGAWVQLDDRLRVVGESMGRREDAIARAQR